MRLRRFVPFLVIVGIGALACLETLPEPTQCTNAKYTYCAIEAVPGAGCPLDANTNDCLKARGCSDEATCARSTSSCFPPPDCPPAVTSVASGAQCLDPRIQAPREMDAGICRCGAASCADVCDGQGPIFGPEQVFRVELPATSNQGGKLGVMIRARGNGTILIEGQSPPDAGDQRPPPFEPVTFQSQAFDDVVAKARGGGVVLDGKPTAFLITTQRGVLEIDCVVPFLVP